MKTHLEKKGGKGARLRARRLGLDIPGTVWHIGVIVLFSSAALTLVAHQHGGNGSPHSRGQLNPTSVAVPERAAVLVRPILDLQVQSIAECGRAGKPAECSTLEAFEHQRERERKMGKLLFDLVRKKGSAADEALVVLMCFYIGESQEEVDAVLRRGKRMLSYLNKYRELTPVLPGREYSGALLKDPSARSEAFRAAIEAIRKGLRSTAETAGEEDILRVGRYAEASDTVTLNAGTAHSDPMIG